MTRSTRKTMLQFASGASNNGQFGSAQLGTKVTSVDPAVIQALSAWANGWLAATISGQQLPTLEEMQGVLYVLSYGLNYIYQDGIPEWDSGTTYYANTSIVKGAGTVQLYMSLTNNNLNNALPTFGTNNTNWQSLVDLTAVTPAATTSTPGVVQLATKAQMITGTSTSLVPSVSVVQNHRGVAKAWLNYDATGPTIRSSYNVSSVTVNGTGDFTINFTTSFANANFVPTCMVQNNGLQNATAELYNTGSPLTVSSCRLTTQNSNGTVSTNFNPTLLALTFHGDQ